MENIDQDFMEALLVYHELFLRERELKTRLDDVKKKRTEKEEMIYNMMESFNMQSVKIDDLGTFYRRDDMYASVCDQDALFDWLQTNGHEGIIKQTVNTRTLMALFKELAEDSGDMTPPPGTTVTIKKRIGIVKK